MKLEMQLSQSFFHIRVDIDKILFEVSDSFSLTGLLGGIKKIIFSGVLCNVSWTNFDCIVPKGVVLLEGQLKRFLLRVALGCYFVNGIKKFDGEK